MPTLKKSEALRELQILMSTREWSADTADMVRDLLDLAKYPLIQLPSNYQIVIEVDQYYRPDGDYDTEQEQADLNSGKLGAYVVILQKECEFGDWHPVQSLSGVVVEGWNHDNTYGTFEGIADPYLARVALELLEEEDPK